MLSSREILWCFVDDELRLLDLYGDRFRLCPLKGEGKLVPSLLFWYASAEAGSELELHFLRVAKIVQVRGHGFVHGRRPASQHLNVGSRRWAMGLDHFL